MGHDSLAGSRPEIDMYPQTVPGSIFYTRIRNDALGGPNPFEWKELSTEDIFKGNRIVLFAVPGAFTPACSESHLPGYEQLHDELIDAGADRIVCLAVNDAFVMHQWALSREIRKVFMLPDGNGDFTRKMGMLVKRSTTGMGMRSWRYSMFVDDRKIMKLFAEDGFADEPPGVPVQSSGADNMLAYLRSLR
jgi:thioredoxin-dependent peroxiredoxin